jgi:hypothetical protein
MKVSLDDLLKFLKKKNYDAKLQSETRQIYTILQFEGKEFPLFLRIFDQSDLLQLLVFMPTQIKPGTHADLARLLHLINKELDIPGFGMDENSGVAFYRCMLPTPGRKIDPELLGAYLKSIELICESVSPSVIAVAGGFASYGDILRAAKESSENPPTKP